MRIEGPERYQLTFGPESFTVLCAKGTDKFSGLAMLKFPKLYVLVSFWKYGLGDEYDVRSRQTARPPLEEIPT
jgi:hypothetical protein